MHDLRHTDKGVEVEEDGERVEHVGEDHPGRLSEHLDLIFLRLRVLQQETRKNKDVFVEEMDDLGVQTWWHSPNMYDPESR